jgi:hypothetical protein
MANRNQLSWCVSLALLLVLPAAAQSSGDKPTVELSGGMRAQLLSFARNPNGGPAGITATVKITNISKDYLFLLFTGAPSGVDDAGATIQGKVSGVGWCRNASPQCIGVPSPYYAFPLQQYTEIDPGTSVTALFTMPLTTTAIANRRVSLSAELAFRSVSDLAKDADLSDHQKLQQVRMGNLGFDAVTITECADCSPALARSPTSPAAVIPSGHPGTAWTPDNRTATETSPGVVGSIGQGITSVVNDRNAAKIFTGERLVWAFLIGIFLFLFWHNQREYRVTGEWNAFAKSAAWVILIGGVWAWVGYFGDHHAFFAWPIVVFVVFMGVLIWRGLAEDRHKKEEAERLLEDEDRTPVFGDAEEATPDDERRAGL